jgi:hypothetical protein
VRACVRASVCVCVCVCVCVRLQFCVIKYLLHSHYKISLAYI